MLSPAIDPNSLLRGLLIGFSIAAPVGPIGILSIRRTLTDGLLMGILTGLGAATADAIYGGIAGFGLTAISNVLIQQGFWLRVLGGLFLCYLGIRIFFSKPIFPSPSDEPAENQKRSLRAAAFGGSIKTLMGAYSSTVFLTLTNPATILSFTAVFAGLGLANSRNSYTEAIVLVLGVFLGSALWWLLLCGSVSLFRIRLNAKTLRWLNRISGLVLLTFGIIALSLRSQ
ncbi:LysE family translocator [Leptolyngbya ohadii]|uniref:LysE family translocator n=1 Tax=Leptolyngbya ohadii TaxID=1962290 RepID=UPI000B59F706|nr:LysE family transporter [Leptolyngbya ohadii]